MAIQNANATGSVGMGTKLLWRCWTTQGVPRRVCSMNAWHLAISSALVGARRGAGLAGVGP